MLSLAAPLLAAALASAAEAPRHQGFFLRLDLGGGWSSTSVSGVDLSGGAVGLGIGVGGNVAENVALFGELFDVAGSPDSGGRGPPLESLVFGGIGIGVTWYAMPANVFLSGVFGLGTLTTRVNGADAHTNPGPVARFGVGKEWLVSPSWGLGVAGYLNLGYQRDAVGQSWKSIAPIVAFSATFY
jgi:hypothetical protein